MSKLLEMPGLRRLLLSPGAHALLHHVCHWEDQDGKRKQVWQHEGGEQGDPQMPLLFSLAVHDALLADKKAGDAFTQTRTLLIVAHVI